MYLHDRGSHSFESLFIDYKPDNRSCEDLRVKLPVILTLKPELNKYLVSPYSQREKPSFLLPGLTQKLHEVFLATFLQSQHPRRGRPPHKKKFEPKITRKPGQGTRFLKLVVYPINVILRAKTRVDKKLNKLSISSFFRFGIWRSPFYFGAVPLPLLVCWNLLGLMTGDTLPLARFGLVVLSLVPYL